MPTNNQYSKCTLVELRTKLKAKNARVSGRKADLVERLEAYDRNDNFTGGVDLITAPSDFKMTLPEHTQYKDITKSASSAVNQLSTRTATAFLELHGDTLDSGHRLYDSKKIRFLRFLRWAHTGETTFYMAQCRAELKRAVNYQVDVSIDSNGVVKETQCECPVGMGPSAHCKHVQAALLASVDFTEGKQPHLELTCTEVLQSFHRPRKLHTGSPVKAKDLKLSKEPLPLNFDPRPLKFRNLSSYPDFVKNITLNYAVNTGNHIPLLQTIKPANMYAYEHDHDYLQTSQSSIFLNKLNITSISLERADDIEEKTEKQDKCAAWKVERRNRMQSSTFGRILRSVSHQAKTNLAKEMIIGKDFVSKYTNHGKMLESEAIAKYETVYDVKVKKSGIVISVDKPYLGCSPDGLVGEHTVLEVKCPYTARNMIISPQTVPYLQSDGVNLTLDPKHDYYAQVQAQMWITERTMCHLAVYTFADMQVIKVPVNTVFINDMVTKLDLYFEDYFKPIYLRVHFYKDL